MDREEKVAICVINKRGKEPSSMSSEKQVDQGVKDIAKIVIANVEDEESTTTYNNVQFEIKSAKGVFLTNRNIVFESDSALQI